MAQAHLKQVEKMTAVDELISGIAHEIKNPLASLSGAIQLLQEDTQQGSSEDNLMQIILRETARLENIVNDIRVFAKPNIDNACELKLPDVISETVELFLNDPKWSRKIRFHFDLDPRVSVCMDPVHFNQILWNLLKNAAQSIEGEGIIKISLYSTANHCVYFSIQDSGKGIDPKDKRHIFDPFYTTKANGTGLGLSIVHRLIDAYGGMINFKSNPDKGTIFIVRFNAMASMSS